MKEDVPALAYDSGATPDLAELLELYGSVGWSAYTKEPQTLVAALRGSTTVVLARAAGRLVGLARVISDGATICYLQDVLIHPDYQRLGIGRELVARALQPYRQVRQKVLLTDDGPGQKSFYEALGYRDTGDFRGGTVRTFVRFD
ncbi:GNAT superfamily N-acetyltransferase [Arthrobacter silviterrae]|uniref:GNAT family N-acetyltransferase n=1 Tax=Arthrobacter silviterrae TaxID=2026658 RepID=A0ABX0DE99_9MICC|nr:MULTISPECIES: GNAT family N-acetyltransferase [Arthrobacter]MCU6480235.1 GNAT family N-acetyltransferase [Arthrobacter sp. A2-55]MDQ0276219.1 GNAT superfamily N-acetyltransferase [Arthrobacter silviterrae]NGN82683.1 GNAT family N-acetyltransferase [Arthrobacter silviterrae]